MDKDVIDCRVPIDNHTRHYFGLTRKPCEICGKEEPSLYLCMKYSNKPWKPIT